MLFWLIAGVMTAVAVALLITPLVQPTRQSQDADDQASAGALAVYRDQLAEIDRDLAAGVLSADQAEAARREVQRRLLAADAARAKTGPRPASLETARKTARRLAIIVIVTVPAATLSLYVWLGAPGTPSRPFAERPQAGTDPIDLAARADALSRRLLSDDGPAEDWALLSRLLAQLERFPEAAEALRRAIGRGLEGAAGRVFLGEILVAANQGRVVREARQAFAWVLEREPSNPYALYYAGLALAQDGHTRQAFDLWVTLARGSPPGASWLPPLRQRIAGAAEDLGVAVPDLGVAVPDRGAGAPRASGAARSGPTRADVDAAAAMTAEEREAFVRGMVERLAARLEHRPDDLDGWIRLGRAYLVLGRYDRARAVLERAGPLTEALPEEAPQRAALDALAAALAAVQE